MTVVNAFEKILVNGAEQWRLTEAGIDRLSIMMREAAKEILACNISIVVQSEHKLNGEGGPFLGKHENVFILSKSVDIENARGRPGGPRDQFGLKVGTTLFYSKLKEAIEGLAQKSAALTTHYIEDDGVVRALQKAADALQTAGHAQLDGSLVKPWDEPDIIYPDSTRGNRMRMNPVGPGWDV